MVETLLLKKGRFLNFTLTFIASFFLVTTSWGQTVTTNKDDYAPGEYVIITGTDWEPGERVDFTFVETPKPETCVNSHDNFAIADASGKIYYDGFLIKINHLGVHFVLTATGQSSGRIAVTEFTDANVKFSTMGLPKNVDVTVQYQGTRPGPTPVNTSVTFSTGGGGNGASGNIALIGNLSFQFPSTITVVGTVYTLVSTTPTSPTTVPENGSFGIEATYIVGKGASTISVNAAGPFTYNTNPQGPDQVTKSGSTGAVTFSYVGVSGTIYSASTSKPTNAGNYQVTATLASDANYNGAVSAPLAFSIVKATPTATLAVSNSPQTYTGSGQSATVSISASSVPGTVTNILTGGSATQTNANTYAVTANFVPNDAVNYNSLTALAAGNFVIGKAESTIITTGTTSFTYTGSAQGPGTSTVTGSTGEVTYSYTGTNNGSVAYGPSATKPTLAGSYSVVATVAADDNYNAKSSEAYDFAIDKANQSITWATPSNIVYGTLLSATQLNATVAVPGSEAHGAITYDPAVDTELAAGDHTLTVNVAGSANYNAASATVELTVEKANQSITWATPSNIVYGTLLSATQLNATVAVPGSEAHGAITYDPAVDTELAAGDHTLTVNVAGSANYNSASATVELTVEKANQSITWATPSDIVYGTLLSATQLNATVAVPGSEAHGAITYDPAVDTELAAGDHTLTVNVAGSANYNSASATVELTVEKANQSIAWATPSNIVYGTLLSATQLNATVAVPGSEAHGAITYDPAVDTELAAGDHTLTVNVAGSANYNSASATVELTVEKANQSITWATPSNIVYGTLLSATQLNATVAVPGSEAHGAITYDPAVDTELAAGDHTLTVNVAGSANYNSASATVELTVEKANQSITWATPSNIVYGTLLSATQLNATVAVPGSEAHGAITYDPAAGTKLDAGNDQALNVDVVGSDNYNSATVTVYIDVTKAILNVTALDKSKFCGQENPALGVSYSGFISGENQNVLDTRPTASTTADGTSTGSSYVITASGGVDNNYSFTYVPGTLSVAGVTIDASGSSNPVQLGTAATLSAQVTPAVAGVSVTFTLSEYNNTNSSTFAQSYTATTGTNGIATVSVANLPSDVYKVTAVAGGGCSSSEAYLPVYDPNGGFVTGGGWIYSDPGNMQGAQAQAEGKANFGFNAKYKTGKNNMTEVDGNTNFQFQAGDLHLKSLSHDNMSLVISGAKATYRGVGTVNGKGNHKFLLIAIDGDVAGGGGVDKFRIKIWKDNSSAILYDNQWLQDENSNEATILGGGSIVIHKPKAGGKTAETTQTLTLEKGTSELTQQPVQLDILGNLAVAPNPVRTDAKVRFSLIEDAGVTVRLFDFNGREIYNLYSGNAKANEVYEVGFQRNNMMSGIYIVRLTTDRGQSYTKNVIVE